MDDRPMPRRNRHARRVGAEQVSDRSAEVVKDGFVARAATPAAVTKRAYFARYFDDPNLYEAWASESLAAFNTIEHAVLTRPFLRPELDRLGWIRRNRRIFFLPNWIEAFIGSQLDPTRWRWSTSSSRLRRRCLSTCAAKSFRDGMQSPALLVRRWRRSRCRCEC